MGHLLSVNVGLPRDVTWQGKTVHTGIWKTPVKGRRMVRRLNIDGDGQGDLTGHGGERRPYLSIRWIPIGIGRTNWDETTSRTGSSERISRSTVYQIKRCVSETVTGSAALCSR